MSRVIFRVAALVLPLAIATGCAFQPGRSTSSEESQQSTGERLRIEQPRTGSAHAMNESDDPEGSGEPSPWIEHGGDGNMGDPTEPEPSPWDNGGGKGGGGSGSGNGGK